MNTNKYLQIAETWANIMDNQFHIGPVHIGLDAILGVLPVGGDTIAALLSFYIIGVAVKLDLPPEKIRKMVVNVILDYFIGLIPVVGDIGDVFFKSNLMNLKLIKEHLNNVVEGEIVS